MENLLRENETADVDLGRYAVSYLSESTDSEWVSDCRLQFRHDWQKNTSYNYLPQWRWTSYLYLHHRQNM